MAEAVEAPPHPNRVLAARIYLKLARRLGETPDPRVIAVYEAGQRTEVDPSSD